MSINITQNLWAALKAPFERRRESAADVDLIDQSFGNGYQRSYWDGTNTNEMFVHGVDTDGAIRIGDDVLKPNRSQVTVHLYPNANLVTQAFFVNPTPHKLYITSAQFVATTVGTVAGATADITHETQIGGLMQAAGTGKTVLSAKFGISTTATAETVQVAGLASPLVRATYNTSVANATPGAGVIVLQPGDSLSIKFSGTLTTLVGLTISLGVAPGSKYSFVSYYLATAASAATISLCTSLRKRTLLYGAELHQVAGTDPGAVTLTLTKDATATAPGAGTAMLASTVNLKSTALTYNQLSLSATAANLALISTDSVAVKVAGTTTALAGVLVTLAFDGKPGEVWLNYNSANSTVGTDEEFWIADRDYIITQDSGKWSATGTSNFASLTIDTGTQTPSTGQVVSTLNTNKGFDTTGSINAPVFDTLAALNTRYIKAGDRIGIHNQGTTGALAGLQLSALLSCN